MADSCQGDVACSKYGAGTPVPVTSFAAAPGEVNRVTVAREGDVFVIRDAGAALQAQAPCQSVDANTARCPVTPAQPGINGLAVALGDGGDEVTVLGDPVVETGLNGGPGDDALNGGGENDTVVGGTGNDALAGGDGTDVLSYAERTEFVHVGLDERLGGELEAGEHDTISGFEVVVGGAGDDRLIGSARAETLDGGTGDDDLRGLAGADQLFGGLGADRLHGFGGDDRLFGDPAQGDDYYTPRVKLRADLLDGGFGDDELYDTGGRNRFLGGFGNDLIVGGRHADRVDAGAGRDRADLRGGGRDRVDCGGGVDRARTDRRDRRRSCERNWSGAA
jgi:Ca2+-binding RTX toxin-like protein